MFHTLFCGCAALCARYPECFTHCCVLVQGFVPGILGISHGALQFMAYEELKTLYNQWRQQALDTRLVSMSICMSVCLSLPVCLPVCLPVLLIQIKIM